MKLIFSPNLSVAIWRRGLERPQGLPVVDESGETIGFISHAYVENGEIQFAVTIDEKHREKVTRET